MNLNSASILRRAVVVWSSLIIYTGTSYSVCVPAIAQTAGGAARYEQRDPIRSLTRDVAFQRAAEFVPGQQVTQVDLIVAETTNLLDATELRHRSYNGGLVGPTIRVRRGQLLNVHLKNLLPPEPAGPHGDNAPHGFNTTNLHTHGLHISPKLPADDVFKTIAPGEEYNYEFPIEADHPAGTYWYHAHKHGSTALQLASGMAGALIVEGGLDDIPEIRAADEKVLVLQQFVIDRSQSPAVIDADGLYNDAADLTVAINGAVTPTITMRPGEVQRWRIIHAGTSEAIFLDAEGVSFYRVAIDGLTTGRLDDMNSLQLYPGGRVDVLVKAPLSAKTSLVYTAIRDPSKAIRQEVQERANVLRIVVAGSPNDMTLPSLSSLEQVRELDDGHVPTDAEVGTLTRELRFHNANGMFTIDGKLFDPANPALQLELDSAEEWTLISQGGTHPFHIHVNPFAVKPTRAGDPWVWRDTVALERNRPVTIRMRFRNFDGLTVLHCHNLVHEDLGMMQAIEIVPAAQRNRSSGTAALSSWQLVSASGKPFTSQMLDGQAYVLVLHRGIGCVHCAAQLTRLRDDYARLEKAGLRVIAVSPELPNDPQGRQLLADFPFPVLEDPELDLFRQLNCTRSADDEVLHGLFVIDQKRRLVFENRSETAVTDPVTMVLQSPGLGPQEKAHE